MAGSSTSASTLASSTRAWKERATFPPEHGWLGAIGWIAASTATARAIAAAAAIALTTAAAFPTAAATASVVISSCAL